MRFECCFAWPLFGGMIAAVLSISPPSVQGRLAPSSALTQASLTIQSANSMIDDRQQRGSAVRALTPATPDPVSIPIPSALSAIPLFALAAAVAARWRHRC